MKAIRSLASLITALAVLALVTACPVDTDDDSPPTTPTTPAATKVTLADGSWGTAGNATITGLTSGEIYVVVSSDGILGVKADGTLGNDLNDAATLSGTAITGLTNGNTYDVYKVSLVSSTGETTTLGSADYNTIVAIPGLDDTDTHTIEAGSSKPGAKYVIVYVEQTLDAGQTGGAITDGTEIEGDTLDYTFGSTTADGATWEDITGAQPYFILDLSALTDGSFTTTITVSTAD